jgi:Tol biopolymer transport system component
MALTPPGTPEPLLPSPARGAAVSRDQKFVAFQSDKSGTPEIYVIPMAGGAAPEKVSSAGGKVPAWAANGRELLYLRDPEIIAVPFTIVDGRFRAGAERVWSRVEGNYHDYVLKAAPDGRVLVAIDRKRTQREIRVIVNWQHEIARKVNGG